MEWMLDIQLGRRNLPPAQRLAVMGKFKKKIQEQAKEKMSEGGGDKKSNDYKNRVSPNGEKRSNIKIHTDKELAKMAAQLIYIHFVLNFLIHLYMSMIDQTLPLIILFP